VRLHHILFLALVGCSGDDASDTTSGTSPTPTTPVDTGPEPIDTELTGEPWLKRGHQGSVVVRRRLASAGAGSTIELFGLFVDDLQGAKTGLWCMDRGVCIEELTQQESDIDGVFRRGESDYDWVGEVITVGNDPRTWTTLPFVADLQANFGVYRNDINAFDEDELPPYRVAFGGEWDEVEIDDAVELPLLPKLRTPNPTEVLGLTQQVQFTWEWPPEDVRPRGSGRLYLRVMSNQVDRMIPLPDEGPFNLDISTWGLNPSSNLEIYFGRWLRQRHVTQGDNELTIWSVNEQPVQTQQCQGSPSVPLDEDDGHSPSNIGVVFNVDQVSLSLDGILDRGNVADVKRQPDPKKAPDLTSSRLAFDLYDAAGNHCAYQYDGSLATPRSAFASDSGALVQQAFNIEPNGASLRVACDASLLEASVTGGSDPIVIQVSPGIAETTTATLNQRSTATREAPKTEPGMHRYDRVYIGADGVGVVQGNEVAVGMPGNVPSIPASAVPLAWYHVEGTDILEFDDERVFTDRMPEDAPVTSVRPLLEGRSWAFGVGESLTHIDRPGVNEGRVWGFFVKRPDEDVGIEIGAGVASHLTDCFEVGPESGPVRYGSGTPITSGLYMLEGYSTFGFEFPEPTGLTGSTGDTGDTADTGP